MRLGTYTTTNDSTPWTGVRTDDDTIVSLPEAGQSAGLALPAATSDLLATYAWREKADLAVAYAEETGVGVYDAGELSRHAPVTEPRKVVCVGLNYRDHVSHDGGGPGTIGAIPSSTTSTRSCPSRRTCGWRRRATSTTTWRTSDWATRSARAGSGARSTAGKPGSGSTAASTFRTSAACSSTTGRSSSPAAGRPPCLGRRRTRERAVRVDELRARLGARRLPGRTPRGRRELDRPRGGGSLWLGPVRRAGRP